MSAMLPTRVWGTLARMVTRALATSAVVLLSIAAPAQALAKASAAEEKFLEAVQAHKSGKAKEAIAALQAAAKADPHPTLLFNLGVLSDAAGDTKGAAKYYAKYLDTRPEDGAIILLRYRQIAPKEAEAWAKARDAGAKKGKPGGEALAKKDKPKKDKPGGDGPRGKASAGRSNVLSYSLLGAGGVALAIGAIFGAMTVTDVNEFMDSRVRSEAQRHADDAESHQLFANIGYVAGLAALGGGVALLLMGSGDEGSAGDVASDSPMFTPMITPDAGGGLLTLSF